VVEPALRQRLINALIVQVERPEKDMSGKATYQASGITSAAEKDVTSTHSQLHS
jgi:hypothetical protein